jgi:hypothetical protein
MATNPIIIMNPQEAWPTIGPVVWSLSPVAEEPLAALSEEQRAVMEQYSGVLLNKVASILAAVFIHGGSEGSGLLNELGTALESVGESMVAMANQAVQRERQAGNPPPD